MGCPINIEEDFPNRISRVCSSKFKSLGKMGKPKDDGEYTLLACIVRRDCKGQLEVVALGTGSKCIGASQLPSNGDVLHDSHAEVIARRAFLLYLIDQIGKAQTESESIFRRNKEGKFEMVSDSTFHFYSSHTPCGDASIFAKQEWSQDCCGEELHSGQNQVSLNRENCNSSENCSSISEFDNYLSSTEPPHKKLKESPKDYSLSSNLLKQDFREGNYDSCNKILDTSNPIVKDQLDTCSSNKQYSSSLEDSDIHRTGAKCVFGEREDPKLPGVNYHITGVLRTKPGRGNPTLSLSCSDKLFKWSVLGIQGALLMHILEEPIYLHTITIGACPYSQKAMERALYDRFKDSLTEIQLPSGFQVMMPRILLSSCAFEYSRSVVTDSCKNEEKIKPSPSSLIWSLSKFHNQKHEVSVNGRKLGTTKKSIGSPKSWVSICRQIILKELILLMKKMDSEATVFEDKSYAECKQLAKCYQDAWGTLKHQVLVNWTSKPHFTKEFRPHIWNV